MNEKYVWRIFGILGVGYTLYAFPTLLKVSKESLNPLADMLPIMGCLTIMAGLIFIYGSFILFENREGCKE